MDMPAYTEGRRSQCHLEACQMMMAQRQQPRQQARQGRLQPWHRCQQLRMLLETTHHIQQPLALSPPAASPTVPIQTAELPPSAPAQAAEPEKAAMEIASAPVKKEPAAAEAEVKDEPGVVAPPTYVEPSFDSRELQARLLGPKDSDAQNRVIFMGIHLKFWHASDDRPT